MFKRIRVAILKRRMDKALAAFTDYQRQPILGQWRYTVARALHQHLVQCEREYSYALNGWGRP